jgi:hypothetical protein
MAFVIPVFGTVLSCSLGVAIGPFDGLLATRLVNQIRSVDEVGLLVQTGGSRL